MRAVTLHPAPKVESDHPAPSPQKGEALVRVGLCGICNTDLELMRGYMNFTGIPGHEFVGEVVEANSTDKDFSSKGTAPPAPSSSPDGQTEQSARTTEDRKNSPLEEVRSFPGRRVVGEINSACGECEYCIEGAPTHCANRTVLGILGRQGAMAEYLTLPIENLHVIPDNVTNEAAVFVEPLAAAYEILEQVEINKSHRVAVMGDGKLGLLCAMALSTTGAEVSLIGRHKRKLKLIGPYGVKTLLAGRDEPGGAYDIVVEATGSAEGVALAMSLTRPRGVTVLKSTVAEGKPLNLAPIVINEITLIGSRCGPFAPAIEALASGVIDPTPLIEATYPIEDAVIAFEHAATKSALKVLVSF